MARLSLIVFMLVFSPIAWSYQIDFTGVMRMDKFDGNDPDQPDLMLVPFEVAADTRTLNFLTMSIWIDGVKLTHPVKDNGHIAEWYYSEGLSQWQASNGFGWSFKHENAIYDLEWPWVEIPSKPEDNPIELFHKVAEGPWYCWTYNQGLATGYSVWPDGPITGTPKKVPEPATLSLLFLGLAAIGLRRRLGAKLT